MCARWRAIPSQRSRSGRRPRSRRVRTDRVWLRLRSASFPLPAAGRAPLAHPPPTPSCCADAELYKARHQEESHDPASVAERGPEIPLAADDLLAWLGPRKAHAFPRTYTHVTPRGSKQVELFANLIEMVEELIDKPQGGRRLSGPLGCMSSAIWPKFGAHGPLEGPAHGRAHGSGGEDGSIGSDDSPIISRHADVQVAIQRPTAGARRSSRPPPPPTGGRCARRGWHQSLRAASLSARPLQIRAHLRE
jgi:hypothetical protein